MSVPLTPEETVNYTTIIDGILAVADLATVSRKKVRQGLERAIGGKDLGYQKNAIKALIEARFDAISQAPGAMPTPPAQPDVKRERHDNGLTNGHGHGHGAQDADGEIQVSIDEPAKKKQKRSSSMVEDEDARLAAELQAQENSLARGRKTRGGGASKPKKTPKKKSASKAKSSGGGDSDLDTEDSRAPKKRKAGGGFQKEFSLSYALSELVGQTQLSRPQVVKKLWEHIKGNELQDPSDKRYILCDEKMQAVFRTNKIDMFTMNKLLGSHLYSLDEAE